MIVASRSGRRPPGFRTPRKARAYQPRGIQNLEDTGPGHTGRQRACARNGEQLNFQPGRSNTAFAGAGEGHRGCLRIAGWPAGCGAGRAIARPEPGRERPSGAARRTGAGWRIAYWGRGRGGAGITRRFLLRPPNFRLPSQRMAGTAHHGRGKKLHAREHTGLGDDRLDAEKADVDFAARSRHPRLLTATGNVAVQSDRGSG